MDKRSKTGNLKPVLSPLTWAQPRDSELKDGKSLDPRQPPRESSMVHINLKAAIQTSGDGSTAGAEFGQAR
jgi:hypothetical protein